MQLKELEDYLWKKYSIKFKPMIGGNKKLFTLQAPGNPNFFAFLSRFNNQEFSSPQPKLSHILTLDVNCGDFASTIRDLPGFSSPFRVKGDQWVGLWLDQVDVSEVKKVVDYGYKLAVNNNQLSDQSQYFVLPAESNDSQYSSQKIPPRKAVKKVKPKPVDSVIQKMRESYDYTVFPSVGRDKNFYIQAKIAADYEDNYDKFYPFKRYYPTYHDMTLGQLRTYFTWRTKLRKGLYEKTSTSYVYVYIYELLNKIGCKDARDGFEKMQSLHDNYVQKFDPEISPYLCSWQRDYAILNNLDLSLVKDIFAEKTQQDEFLQKLARQVSEPVSFTQEVLEKSKYRSKSPLEFKKFAQLFSFVWQELLKTTVNNHSFYNFYIAQKKTFLRPIYASAVVYHKDALVDKYEIDANHEFTINDGKLYETSLEPIPTYLSNLKRIVHEVDRLSRIFYKKGRQLKDNNLSPLLLDTIKKAIVEFHKQSLEAARPKIDINFNDIGKIRQDASITRESLLTDEEKQLDESDRESNAENTARQEPDQPAANSYNLSADENYFLMALLKHTDWNNYLQSKHLMASILADSINEKLFDEIGDSVIEFEKDQPRIIEDYQEDLEEMFLKGK